jgi:hypothetical protein
MHIATCLDNDLLRESRSWRYSRRKILSPGEFSGLAAENLSGVSSRLRSKVPASRIDKAASECLWQANILDVDPKTDNAWIVVRDRGINDARIRTFVAHATSSMRMAIGKEMCGTVATLTNVVFDRNDINAKMVREMMRLPRSRPRGSSNEDSIQEA